MSKVVTSEGLKDFIETGKPTEVIEKKAKLNEKLAQVDKPEIKAETPPEVPPEQKADAKPDDGLEAEDHDLADRAKKRIGKKHYEMKKAQEEAQKAREEAEQDARLAENLFNEREMWKKRAEEAERVAQEAKAKPQVAELPLVEPNQADTKYWNDKKEFQLTDFLNDRDKWRDESQRRQAAADRAREQEEAGKKENEKVESAFRARIEKATDKYPDFKEKVGNSDFILPLAVLDYMRRSEYGVDLTYFLATHKDVAESIKSKHFTLGIAELRDLETSFKKPAIPAASEKTTEAAPTATSKTVERQGAPAPITPIPTGGSPTPVDPAKMDFKQLRAYERERARSRR